MRVPGKEYPAGAKTFAAISASESCFAYPTTRTTLANSTTRTASVTLSSPPHPQIPDPWPLTPFPTAFSALAFFCETLPIINHQRRTLKIVRHLPTRQAALGGTTMSLASEIQPGGFTIINSRATFDELLLTIKAVSRRSPPNTAQVACNMKYVSLQVRNARVKVPNTPVLTLYFPGFLRVSHIKATT